MEGSTYEERVNMLVDRLRSMLSSSLYDPLRIESAYKRLQAYVKYYPRQFGEVTYRTRIRVRHVFVSIRIFFRSCAGTKKEIETKRTIRK